MCRITENDGFYPQNTRTTLMHFLQRASGCECSFYNELFRVMSLRATMFLCICMPDKRAHCDAFFNMLGVSPVYITPVNKHTLSLPDLYAKGIVSRTWTRRAPLPGAPMAFEVACALSHLSACQHIVESGVPWACVFEDDNIIVNEQSVECFKQIIGWAELNISTFNVINLSPCNSVHTSCVGLCPGAQGCTNALLYSRQGAMYVTQNILPVQSPIDDWLHNNMPGSSCLHKRIFAQQDTQQWSILAVLNPVLWKREYLINSHSVCVYGLYATIVLSAISMPFWISSVW